MESISERAQLLRAAIDMAGCDVVENEPSDGSVEGGPNESADTGDSRVLPIIDDPRAVKILQHMLAGWTFDQIARELRVDHKTVWALRRTYGIDAVVDDLIADMGRATSNAYMAMRQAMLKRTAELINDPAAEVALQAVSVAAAFVAKRESTPRPSDPRTAHAQRRAAATLLPAVTGQAPAGKAAAERLRKR